MQKLILVQSALLLNNDSLVRFIPNANYNGTSTFEFRAWDKSSGTIGGTTNPFALGGNTSISSEVKTATITINSVMCSNYWKQNYSYRWRCKLCIYNKWF